MHQDGKSEAQQKNQVAAADALEVLRLRVHGDPGLPTVIYLPGLHGDWTLVGGFRKALEGKARFVEFTYPRTTTWSLEEYASAIESALAHHGISRGWIVAESFGSQVAWPLVQRGEFGADGLILAGGFVRHPVPAGVWLAERITARMSLRAIKAILFWYAKIAKWRFRRTPEVLKGLDEFLTRRTELDRDAATARLHLLAGSDPTSVARCLKIPLFGITGLLDPIVPWACVRSWLKKNCPELREYRIIAGADHTVLATAPREAADQVLRWISRNESKLR